MKAFAAYVKPVGTVVKIGVDPYLAWRASESYLLSMSREPGTVPIS